MKIEQRHWTQKKGWQPLQEQFQKSDIVFIFGETQALKQENLLNDIKYSYPGALLFGCSTAGEIQGSKVFDDSVGTTAVKFASTRIQSAHLQMSGVANSFEAGSKLASSLVAKDLTHVLVLSTGLNINGSELVKGFNSVLPQGVTLSGGLAGDKDRFKETLVICDSAPSQDMVAAVGLYGPHIKVNSASLGGWDPFGPTRLVTKSKGNVLYELDGKSALELYKTYLGDHAKDLPSSALLFPLSLLNSIDEKGLVRTVLGIDEAAQSMTFAGDIPEGTSVQLMRANFDRLVDGAIGAAENTKKKMKEIHPELALLISCVGRKLVLKQRIEEEVEGVRDVLGETTVLTGFYSYGEISPFTPEAKCELHNQTMTITTLAEGEDRIG